MLYPRRVCSPDQAFRLLYNLLCSARESVSHPGEHWCPNITSQFHMFCFWAFHGRLLSAPISSAIPWSSWHTDVYLRRLPGGRGPFVHKLALGGEFNNNSEIWLISKSKPSQFEADRITSLRRQDVTLSFFPVCSGRQWLGLEAGQRDEADPPFWAFCRKVGMLSVLNV